MRGAAVPAALLHGLAAQRTRSRADSTTQSGDEGSARNLAEDIAKRPADAVLTLLQWASMATSSLPTILQANEAAWMEPPTRSSSSK